MRQKAVKAHHGRCAVPSHAYAMPEQPRCCICTRQDRKKLAVLATKGMARAVNDFGRHLVSFVAMIIWESRRVK